MDKRLTNLITDDQIKLQVDTSLKIMVHLSLKLDWLKLNEP